MSNDSITEVGDGHGALTRHGIQARVEPRFLAHVVRKVAVGSAHSDIEDQVEGCPSARHKARENRRGLTLVERCIGVGRAVPRVCQGECFRIVDIVVGVSATLPKSSIKADVHDRVSAIIDVWQSDPVALQRHRARLTSGQVLVGPLECELVELFGIPIDLALPDTKSAPVRVKHRVWTPVQG